MLTPEAVNTLPVGSKIYDCHGDELTRVELGWVYSAVLVGTVTRSMTIESLWTWAPYSMVPPIDPADPQYDPKRDARR